MSAEPEFDLEGFARLSQADQRDLVIARLEERAKQFANVSYRVVENRQNVTKQDGSFVEWVGKDRYEMRVLGDACWMHVTSFRSPQDERDVRSDVFDSWDGHVQRALYNPPYQRVRFPRGQVEPQETAAFANHKLAELLGFRIQVDTRNLPMIAWLRKSIAGGGRVDVTSGSTGGNPWIVLRLHLDGWVREIAVDPSRGFMIVRVSNVYGKNWATGVTECVESAQISGVWCPTRARRRSSVYYTKEETVFDFEVRDYRFGQVSEKDVALSFPPDTEVVDRVQHVAYKVLKDGQMRLLPLLLEDGVTMRRPAPGTTVPRIDGGTSRFYNEDRRPGP